MTRPPALRNHLGHLVHLSLRTPECAEPLLRELARALVLAIAEKFDNAALVRCVAVYIQEALVMVFPGLVCACGVVGENVPGNLLYNVPDERCPLAQVTLHARDARLGLAGGDFLCIGTPLARCSLLCSRIARPCFGCWWWGVETYVAGIEPDGQARPLLDFLRHVGDGGRKWYRWPRLSPNWS